MQWRVREYKIEIVERRTLRKIENKVRIVGIKMDAQNQQAMST